MPNIDTILNFFRLRQDRNGDAMSWKFSKPEQHNNGFWRLPIASFASPCGEQWSTAWHGTQFQCLYSILYHERLLESTEKGHMKNNLQGVYCHMPTNAKKAENYMVFENLCGNCHWWGALLE